MKQAEMVPALSLENCLAKSRKLFDGSVRSGRRIVDHCLIVGEVARGMIGRMPLWMRSELFPYGSELVAASHDIGKVSPTFQKKIYSSVTLENQNIVSQLKDIDPDIEMQWGGHAGVSQATAAGLQVGRYIPEIVGQHHGSLPNLSFYRKNSEVFGGDPWFERRVELVEKIKSSLKVDFPEIKTPLQARVLAGLTTVSDWIGSGSLFENPDDHQWSSKIEQALDQAGFFPPKLITGLSFYDVFELDPNDGQRGLSESVNQPGVYILEAPMGSGKTEAALYSAYKMMAMGQATGLYFALPTQLASDRIYDRVNSFLKTILDDCSPHKNALLLHGNAWLKETEIGEEGSPGRSWFSQGKRGILAPFAVGTIDQALMAVMNVKYGFIRTFGLVGKVVVLDEVHSYDSFTGTILDALVTTLRKLHCTVIILSATLTQERRSIFLESSSTETAYPLISALPTQGSLREVVPHAGADTIVALSLKNEEEVIEETLNRAESGQQVLWIENTVGESQSTFKRLAARSKDRDVSCGLLHSRFTKSDRTRLEEHWVRLFGKEGTKERSSQGRILVGTQVLEQSLDIDADFLVTRIAPIDMVLQRIGRLWRHEKLWRPALASRETWILSPTLESVLDNPDGFGGTGKVYAPYVLCRTLMILKDLSEISLPGQIRSLIEEVYEKREEVGQMKIFLDQVTKRTENLRSLALLGLSEGGKTLPEEKAETRYSTREEVEVLLIRSFEPSQRSLRLLDNTTLNIPSSSRPLNNKDLRSLSLRLINNTLRVPIHLAPGSVHRQALSWLADYLYLGNSEESQLRIGIVGEDGQVRSINWGEANERYVIGYDSHIGYQTKKRR
jgi:CRISPR-associated endonuclease/helicase Cas3